jgi:hypothetical protein
MYIHFIKQTDYYTKPGESDCCLIPMSNFLAISWQKIVTYDEMIMISILY